MPKLIGLQNQFEYSGKFINPLFSLYGNGSKIIEGLFTTFSPYNISLSDIRDEPSSPRFLESAITVTFGYKSIYRWKLDRVEFTLLDFS
ncbi:MAG: hypothetical protein AB1489_31355, partial [Acidobacteriota bacterium]